MAIVTGRSAAKDICEALGIDVNVTYRVQLDMRADEAGKVAVWQYLTDEQAAKLGVLCKQYELVPKADG